jgi:hypothetical protein
MDKTPPNDEMLSPQHAAELAITNMDNVCASYDDRVKWMVAYTVGVRRECADELAYATPSIEAKARAAAIDDAKSKISQHVCVSINPSPVLIDSMCVRYRHDFGLLCDRVKDSIRITMRQLHEEVVGKGYYRGPL